MKQKIEGLYPCPICGRDPRVGCYQPNYAWAECRGGLFSRHKPVRYETRYKNPSKLRECLVAGWNSYTFKLWFEEIWPAEKKRAKRGA